MENLIKCDLCGDIYPHLRINDRKLSIYEKGIKEHVFDICEDCKNKILSQVKNQQEE